MLMMDTYCYVGCWCGRWWWLISSSYSGSTQMRLCSQASSIPHCLYTAKGYGGQIDWNILRLLGVWYWFPAELTRIRSIPHDWVEYPQQLQMFCRSDSEKMRTSDDHHIGGKQYSNNLAVIFITLLTESLYGLNLQRHSSIHAMLWYKLQIP